MEPGDSTIRNIGDDISDEISDETSDDIGDDIGDHTIDRIGTPPGASAGQLDLDAIEADLAGVEIALARLEAGTYWTCEVTGQPLPDDLLAADPVARRLQPTRPSESGRATG